MKIADWPKAEQPRTRLLLHGAEGLSDAELVAVCIATGYGADDALAFARNLLKRFGDLTRLLHAEPGVLLRVPGLGPAKVAALKACLALAERSYAAELSRRVVCGDSQVVMGFLRHALGGLQRETFACLYLDTRHRLIAFEKLFFGSVDRASVYPREILKRALAHNAAAVIFAHNHPSGVPEPSPSDIQMTSELKSLLGRLEVTVLDHVVVGCGREVSFAERGLL